MGILYKSDGLECCLPVISVFDAEELQSHWNGAKAQFFPKNCMESKKRTIIGNLDRVIFVSSVDSLDWKEQGADAERRQVLEHKHLGNGSIILFHNDAKYTPEVLDSILKGLKEKGFDIVPISELILRDDFEMDHEGRQKAKNGGDA